MVIWGYCIKRSYGQWPCIVALEVFGFLPLFLLRTLQNSHTGLLLIPAYQLDAISDC